MSNSLKYDIVIFGSGVAGCATAIALINQDSKLKIAILERDIADSAKLRIGETLPPQASQQLQQLGIWDSFVSCNFLSSYGTSAAWGSSALYTNEFIYSPFGYGWNLDRMVFDRLMADETKKRGVTFLYKTSCNQAIKNKAGWDLNCTSEQHQLSITAKFVVDATGKKASFCSLRGVEKIQHDQLVGIYRLYDLKENKTRPGIGKGTLIETDAFGWWYSATIPDNKLVVGYMTDADIANNLQLRKLNELNNQLFKTNYTYQRIQNTLAISQPKIVAAHTQYLSAAVGNSWLAVGDAASSYDPVSSLGIFKSLAMSRFASYAILNHLNGDLTGLKKYQQIITDNFQSYQIKKQAYYNQENRFSTQPFWIRRQSRTANPQFKNQNIKNETQFFI